ncbi:MAG: polysaccharide pyruvyl transferase family protein [Elusimicrobia bacterium]|nr:polysaccharide pyruvyl transferase family protein [Elusimicrobiota bacterium]
MNESRPYRIGICGSYGGLNVGDEAILHGILGQIRANLPDAEITVFSRNPKDTLARHGVARAIPVRDMTKDEVMPEIERLDLFILGGGGILFDSEANIFLREAMLAQEKRVPVLVYAVSAGPLKDNAARELVRDAMNKASIISVRERHAQKLLEEIGVTKEIHLTADPALLLQPEPLPEDALKKEGLEKGQRLIGISVREPGPAAPDLNEAQYHALFANTCDFLVERYDAQVVFVPMELKNADVQHSHAIIAQMAHAQRATVLKGEYSSGQVLSFMKNLEFVVGMRLHFLIFAALQGVPFVALPYAGKVAGFLEDLGMTSPPVQQVNPGRLIAYIDRSWDLRREIKDQIAKKLPELQERARQTNKLADALLKFPAGAR